MPLTFDHSGYLDGHLLIATPLVTDGYFNRSVIYLCVHNDQGAMGIIINYKVDNIRYEDLLEQLQIPYTAHARSLPVHVGGPIDSGRGFILHTGNTAEDTLFAHGGITLSSNIQLLRDIVAGCGPAHSLLALGYAGWSPGQLESEIESGSWLTVPATPELVFSSDNDSKWSLAALSQGIDFGRFSYMVGHA